MQFPQQLITELIAPNTTPFQPGNNVIGFGSQLPPELVAIGYTAAIVIYGSDYSPVRSTPQVKFRFITIDPNIGAILFGYGIVNNALVSQTALVRTVLTLGFQASATANSDEPDIRFYNRNGSTIASITSNTLSPDTPIFTLFRASDGTVTTQFSYSPSSGNALFTLGGWFVQNNPDLVSMPVCNQPLLVTTAWISIAPVLTNGWVTDPVFPAQYRILSSGMVQCRGGVTKPSPVANGELWMSGLGAAFHPPIFAWFLVPPAIGAYNGTSKVKIRTDGAAEIWDHVRPTGDFVLDGCSWPIAAMP